MPNNMILDFGDPEKENSIIKVIGVGGGGGNAVNHMYREGIHDVTFVLCNTDNQALNDSPVPVHLQLGKEGLGAGNKPEKARQAAEESLADVKNMLSDGTKMAFITAGMGGGVVAYGAILGACILGGLFETVLIRNPSNPIQLQKIINSLLTENLDDELIIFRRTSKVAVKCNEEVPWTVDGEFGGNHKTARIANIRKAVSLMLKEKKA